MQNLFVIKGTSGTGKGTRVAQLIEFLHTKEEPDELFFTSLGKTPKQKPLGLLFRSLGLVFIGGYTVSNKSGLASWTSMDSLHAALKTGEAARAELKKLFDQGYSLVCEGEPLMMSDKWRPEFLMDFFKPNKLVMVYFHYTDRKDYDERIKNRSGKPAGDSGWSRNESYGKEYVKTCEEMMSLVEKTRGNVVTTCQDFLHVSLYGGDTLMEQQEIVACIKPHDEDLWRIGEIILGECGEEGYHSCAKTPDGLNFRQFCIQYPVLRDINGLNPLAHRIAVVESPAEETTSKSVNILDKMKWGKK